MRHALQPEQVRAQSRLIAMKAGIEIPDHLPFIDPIHPRACTTVIDRALCLHVVLSMAHGLDRAKAEAWLRKEGVLGALTSEERALLWTGKGDIFHFQAEVEAMWALAWALGIADDLDPFGICGDDLAYRLPDPAASESSMAFRKAANLRSADEILQALDIAYCLHWAVRQAQLDRRPPPAKLDPLTVEERRHALEWLAGECDWDEPIMDT